jgi:hypothetical protein
LEILLEMGHELLENDLEANAVCIRLWRPAYGKERSR